MANGDVSGRVSELRVAIIDDTIADAKERRRFWTSVMRDSNADMKDRLKASELSGKADGDFIERREITGKDGGPIKQDVIVTDPNEAYQNMIKG